MTEGRITTCPPYPKIICFCGSSRFVAQMGILMWEYEKAGHIALGLHWLPEEYWKARGLNVVDSHLAEAEGIADKMDELHKRKIDLSDEIFVVNVGGYIGDSTKSEVAYARAQGKKVVWLEKDKAL